MNEAETVFGFVIKWLGIVLQIILGYLVGYLSPSPFGYAKYRRHIYVLILYISVIANTSLISKASSLDIFIGSLWGHLIGLLIDYFLKRMHRPWLYFVQYLTFPKKIQKVEFCYSLQKISTTNVINDSDNDIYDD